LASHNDIREKYFRSHPRARLVLDDYILDGETSWNRDRVIRFSLSNVGDSIVNVREISLEVLDRHPAAALKAWGYGAIPETYRYHVALSPEQDRHVLSRDEFAYAHGDIDRFEVRLTSEQYYVYRLQVGVAWYDVADRTLREERSQPLEVEFPIADPGSALAVVERILARKSRRDDKGNATDA
jgi:hypothetical protein